MMDLAIHYKPMAAFLMAIIGWPLISAVINALMRKRTAEEWEKWALAKPSLALLVQLTRALGWDMKSVGHAFQLYAERKAGESRAPVAVPPDLLKDPVKAKMLNEFIQAVVSVQSPPPLPPTASSTIVVEPESK